MTTPTSNARRIRKTPQERIREITAATTKLIAQKGYNGLSVQDVADEVGLTPSGVLRYVGTKKALLDLVLADDYDHTATPASFFETKLPGSDPEQPHFPAYLRYLVRENVKRSTKMRMYMMLQSESLNENHPLHNYYRQRPDKIWELYSRYPWLIPPSIGSWDTMRSKAMQCIAAIDGLQIRYLRLPPIDLYDEWLEFERMIFPSPLWDAYR